MEYYLVVIAHVMGIMHYFSLNDIVALCWILSKVELIIFLAVIVMMFLMTIVCHMPCILCLNFVSWWNLCPFVGKFSYKSYW